MCDPEDCAVGIVTDEQGATWFLTGDLARRKILPALARLAALIDSIVHPKANVVTLAKRKAKGR